MHSWGENSASLVVMTQELQRNDKKTRMLCTVQSASAFISISASCTGTGEKAAEGCVKNFTSVLCLLSPPERGWCRNPSKAFYQAFQSGSRLRDSKAHSDRYGTGPDRTGVQCPGMCAVSAPRLTCMLKRSLAERVSLMLCSNNGWFAGGAARGRGRLHVFCLAHLQVLPAGPRMG